MIRKGPLVLLLVLNATLYLAAQPRSVRDIFPAIRTTQLNEAFSAGGYLYSGTTSGGLTLNPRTGETLGITKTSLGNPGFFVEALRIVPRRETSPLQIYNALQHIRSLKEQLYHSATRNRYIPLFPDAVRIEGPNRLRSFLPDPPPAAQAPSRQLMYVRFTDANFGHCYYTILLSTNTQAVLCRINNFKAVSFGPIPVIKENAFVALLYMEPVTEGLVIYCLAGAEVSDFIAKHVNISSALRKRMDVIVAWVLDGLQ
ncbi:MAG: hypothetical protein LBP60_08350 [Spirochaetaceae bacterium]|nr:hypothetical protein [Spirochaetaceae bacterium]